MERHQTESPSVDGGTSSVQWVLSGIGQYSPPLLHFRTCKVELSLVVTVRYKRDLKVCCNGSCNSPNVTNTSTGHLSFDSVYVSVYGFPRHDTEVRSKGL